MQAPRNDAVFRRTVLAAHLAIDIFHAIRDGRHRQTNRFWPAMSSGYGFYHATGHRALELDPLKTQKIDNRDNSLKSSQARTRKPLRPQQSPSASRKSSSSVPSGEAKMRLPRLPRAVTWWKAPSHSVRAWRGMGTGRQVAGGLSNLELVP